MRRKLIKEGTPLPGKPSFKLDSSHLKASAADKRADKIEEKRNKEALIIDVPRQHVVYQRTKKVSPKTPKLR